MILGSHVAYILANGCWEPGIHTFTSHPTMVTLMHRQILYVIVRSAQEQTIVASWLGYLLHVMFIAWRGILDVLRASVRNMSAGEYLASCVRDCFTRRRNGSQSR
ncbi:hypothetical protein FKP32DRAFT_453120 [Trametes sanguinea]|nr:hypothetical protein FKP32DRAFT_453120 [Trametes sanguinea]